MELELRRQPTQNGTTLGKLYVDQEIECETLEDTERPLGEKIEGQTAIPIGRYPVIITESVRFHRPLPLVMNVPNFLGIRIHAGNDRDDTEGCILVGRYHVGATLEHSRAALERLQPKIEAALARGEEVWLTVCHAT